MSQDTLLWSRKGIPYRTRRHDRLGGCYKLQLESIRIYEVRSVMLGPASVRAVC